MNVENTRGNLLTLPSQNDAVILTWCGSAGYSIARSSVHVGVTNAVPRTLEYRLHKSNAPRCLVIGYKRVHTVGLLRGYMQSSYSYPASTAD
jgi:hypothetical protein